MGSFFPKLAVKKNNNNLKPQIIPLPILLLISLEFVNDFFPVSIAIAPCKCSSHPRGRFSYPP